MIDKSTWGDGPWQNEPDEYLDEVNGWQIFAKRGFIGVWKGYLNIENEDILDVIHVDTLQVHGGITYTGNGEGTGLPFGEGYYWIGFDCGHYKDIFPGHDARMKVLREALMNIPQELRDLHNIPDIELSEEREDATYKDLKFVLKELYNLAKQINKQLEENDR